MTASPDVSPCAAGSAEAPSHRGQQELAAPCLATTAESGERRTRRLLLLERTMYRDGLTPFTSVFTVSLRGELNEMVLRQSLAQMQAGHPLLRCRVEAAADGPQFVACREPAPVSLRIVERSSAFDWESEVRREWITPFGAAEAPLVRLVWLRGKGVHDLMLVAHHCICDGASGMTLLRDCFAAYEDPPRNTATYRPLGALEDLIPGELLRNRAFRLRAGGRAVLLRLALAAKRRSRREEKRGPSADEFYFHRRQLHAVEADRLAERCREENASVFAASGVAFLQAFGEVRGAGALKHAYSMVNARRFLPQLRPDALFGMAPGVEIGIKPLLSADRMFTTAFWDHARAFRRGLTVRIDRLGRRFYENLAALEGLHDRYARLVADTDSASGVRHVTFSNLGRLDLPRQYRGFRVEHVYSPLVMVSPSPANTVVLSSFGGAMEFAIISDEQALPRADAAAIQERAMAILRTCAGIAPRDEAGPDRQITIERAAMR